MLKHYVEYVYPGCIVSESSKREVTDRIPELAREKMPEGAFGFRFMDRQEMTSNGETLSGEFKDIGSWHYEGTMYTIEEVKSLFPDKEILISNMECNHWNRVVKTKFGQFINLNDGDVVLAEKVETPRIVQFKIYCSMGRSDDWKQLNLEPEQLNMLRNIGYNGTKATGYTFEEYLNEIHAGKYEYKVEYEGGNAGEYTDRYTVTRVRL